MNDSSFAQTDRKRQVFSGMFPRLSFTDASSGPYQGRMRTIRARGPGHESFHGLRYDISPTATVGAMA